MQKMKLFLDTHDKKNGTFPDSIGKDVFAGVYEKYAAACDAEGVVIISTMLNAADGRMFCLNMAPDKDAVKRAHDRIGLGFDTITEVTSTTPGDIYFKWK